MLTSRAPRHRAPAPPRLEHERGSMGAPPLRPHRRPPRRSFGTVLAAGLLVSAVVHLLVLLLSPIWLRIGEPPGEVALEVDRFERPEIQLVNPVASESAPLEPREAPPLERLPLSRSATEPPRPAFVPRAGARDAPQEQAPAAAPGAPATSSDRLRPGARDPRLWVNPRDISRQPQQSDLQRYQEHLQARIDAVNDSMAVAARENRRTRDWTFKDAQGRTWGIGSGGSINLGDVRIPPGIIPMPAPTGDNQSLERQREIERQREEIRAQEEARERRRQPPPNPDP